MALWILDVHNSWVAVYSLLNHEDPLMLSKAEYQSSWQRFVQLSRPWVWDTISLKLYKKNAREKGKSLLFMAKADPQISNFSAKNTVDENKK